VARLMADGPSTLKTLRVASATALEALIREIHKQARVVTRTTTALQTFFERRAHPLRSF
jgi:hypothetical protein